MTKPSTPSIAPARLEQINEFLSTTDYNDGELKPLAGDASFRRYIRIHKAGKTAMLMDAPPEKENVRPYVAIADYLVKQGFSAPTVLAQHIPGGLLLLEDLGDDSFTLVLKNAGAAKDERERELYESAIDVLASWHDDKKRFTDRDALPLPNYNSQLLMQEACLFTDWFLPQVVGKDKAAALRNEYVALWQDILASTPLQMDIWVHRDYHADNLMWLPDRNGVRRVGLLDFQDGVYGDAAYDMVSLLEDARRDVPPAIVEAMLERYIESTGTDRERFMTAYAVLGAQRNSKIVGIFSRLAARDNKFSYLQFLPRVWRYLERDLAHPSLAPLRAWIDKHVPADQRGVITVRHTSQELARTA